MGRIAVVGVGRRALGFMGAGLSEDTPRAVEPIGTRLTRIRDVGLSPIDEHHCMAHVAWTGTYARKDQPDAVIDFDVHYFVQKLDGEPRVFGWVSGDEQALLARHGVV